MTHPKKIHIHGPVLDLVERAAIGQAPDEACGLLIGQRTVITDAVQTDNLSATPYTHFELDAAVHLRLQRILRGSNQQILGIFHSHPQGTAYPSKADIERACYPGWIWLITALDETSNCKTRAFLDRGGAFEEILLKRIQA